MGLVSQPSLTRRRLEDENPVKIVDVFEIRAEYGLQHSAGLVTVLESSPHLEPPDLIGRGVRLETPNGRPIHATIAEVKQHGPTSSFFFEGLSKADVPIGTRISFEAIVPDPQLGSASASAST